METTTGKSGQQEATNELLQLVSFKIGDEEYGVDIVTVQEINRMLNITQVPNSPDYVDGVVNLRGRVIPIIDLRTRLHMERRQHDKNTRIVVLEIKGRTVGMVVDGVREVLRIPPNVAEMPPDTVSSNVNTDYITSIAKLEDRLLMLLDTEKILLTTNEMTIN
ncbi:MAG TPA: chemotaxis protein CheW [Bacteroidota bacterium]|nr:chemotaxis protein CheW [Bacteroidota bacterium]